MNNAMHRSEVQPAGATDAPRPVPASRPPRCLTGPRGRLGIALAPEAVTRLRAEASPTHWLLPIEDPDLVRHAARLSGEVLWLSSCPPALVLGALQDGFRGAWRDGNAIVVALDGCPQRLPLDLEHRADGSLADVIRVVAQVWTRSDATGAAPSPIQLDRQTEILLAAA